ncbi:MAG: hypothetical protein HQK64_13560 [Desulfamplus sp.]|nr:hypothetical protein [Desulfamplus sp.]
MIEIIVGVIVILLLMPKSEIPSKNFITPYIPNQADSIHHNEEDIFPVYIEEHHHHHHYHYDDDSTSDMLYPDDIIDDITDDYSD